MKFLVERLVLKGVAIGSFKKYIDCHYRMYLLFSLYIAALFVALTPGVLLRIPKGGSKLTVAVVHGLVFSGLYCLTYGLVSRTLYADGFQSFFQSFGVDSELMAARRRFEDLQQKANQAKVDSRAARAAFMSASASARAALRTAAAAAEARWAAANTAAMTAAAEVKAVEVRAAAAMAAVAEQRAAARRAWM